MTHLCLSGGGFRATLFHLGAVRRLNELGVLSSLATIVSVSGGSILNAMLATRWSALVAGPEGSFENFDEAVAAPVRQLCASDLRTPLLLGARLNPLRWLEFARNCGAVSGNALARAYEEAISNLSLRHLPSPATGSTPRFVFCATCVQTGACWHFHGGPDGRMGDFYSGYTDTSDVSVADAVAASSAFPLGFSAFRLPIAQRQFTRTDPWGLERPVSAKRSALSPRVVREVRLTDGGVYDNLGVEPIWDRADNLLVSDAGRPFSSVTRCRQSIGSRLSRAAMISIEQVGAVRKRWLIDRFVRRERVGAFWGINTPIEDYGLANAVGYGPSGRRLFSDVRTDLNAFSVGEIACLENHGYSLADVALRARAPSLCAVPAAPFVWPHEQWCADEQLNTALRHSGSRRIWRDALRYATGIPISTDRLD